MSEQINYWAIKEKHEHLARVAYHQAIIQDAWNDMNKLTGGKTWNKKTKQHVVELTKLIKSEHSKLELERRNYSLNTK